ncbi:hypothetical protein AR457_36760 [Streptomyces agglomeratus]|uniref:RdlA protein n=1 Tax=Streptomyces agglomeratus TaxID=285458 RepID=A0A1E5NYI7_9ACTN|nr:hypothetical protein [Streptomyces agglomeratus]OEJ21385.1 hypothetical protein AS594_38030 [Streptomyces agglomeratus]OEJ22810.1 hypothetical protein AR457_36760 [Streptomyces agglomeratus]OEJ36764.1 hypothetical protein BGK72_37165 [Streptomyces agglomeratus]OEJ56483.1 hypothetical protein BGM19_38095 [Streptomyces agglomeratus]
MRKFQHIALVVAAAGGLSAVGAGSSSAVTPVAYNGAPPPVSQPDAQAASASSAQASAQTYGSPASRQAAPQQASPQRGAQVNPQVNPQLNPQINPQLTPQAPQAARNGQGAPSQANLFRPSQECSPQNLIGANVPVALLAASQTHGVECTQANSQANSFSSAQAQ